MVTILMISAKLASQGLLKIKIFWNKGYDDIILDNGVTNKILWRDPNYIVDVVTWSKFGNLAFLWEKRSYHNLNFTRISPEKALFSRGSLGSSQ